MKATLGINTRAHVELWMFRQSKNLSEYLHQGSQDLHGGWYGFGRFWDEIYRCRKSQRCLGLRLQGLALRLWDLIGVKLLNMLKQGQVSE